MEIFCLCAFQFKIIIASNPELTNFILIFCKKNTSYNKA